MLVLSTKPLQKLTGTDRQADGQTGRRTDGQTGRRTGKPTCRKAAPPKNKMSYIIIPATKIKTISKMKNMKLS